MFLILIAVALFAALSYVVVQSSRSGAGSADTENKKLEAAKLANFFVAIATEYQKQSLTSKVQPSIASGTDFGLCSGWGGGCLWDDVPTLSTTVMVRKQVYSLFAAHSGQNRGLTLLGDSPGDEIVWLQGIPLDICEEIDKGMGLTSVPTSDFPNNPITTTAEISACTENPDGTGVYYYVLLAV